MKILGLITFPIITSNPFELFFIIVLFNSIFSTKSVLKLVKNKINNQYGNIISINYLVIRKICLSMPKSIVFNDDNSKNVVS